MASFKKYSAAAAIIAIALCASPIADATSLRMMLQTPDAIQPTISTTPADVVSSATDAAEPSTPEPTTATTTTGDDFSEAPDALPAAPDAVAPSDTAAATANATEAPLPEEEAAAAAATPPAPLEFPVYNYTTIWPNGIFNPAAYEAWTADVGAYYASLYDQGVASAASAVEAPIASYFSGASIPAMTSWYPGQYAEQFMSALRG